MKFSRVPSQPVVALVLALSSLAIPTTSVIAQASKPSAIRFVPPSLAISSAPAGRPRGGASRGQCPVSEVALTALTPFSEEVGNKEQAKSVAVTKVLGLTTKERPTFWFYSPYTNQTVRAAEFSLQDDEGNDIYRTSVTLPKQAGILQVVLPSTVTALETGKTYSWYFKVFCDVQQNQPPIFVEGGIQRIELSDAVKQQLAGKGLQQQAAIYATHGVWYDALTIMAGLRQTAQADTNLVASWNDLLGSVGLNEVARQPFVQ